MAPKKRPGHSWRDIRSVLNNTSHKDMLGLVSDLYKLRKENQSFLHARYVKDASTLIPYLETIEHYISPIEPWKNPVKISLARKAISDYRKAAGDPEGLAELMLYYVECGVNFTFDFGDIDEAFYSSLVRMFSDGLKMLGQCNSDVVNKLLPRFKDTVHSASDMGWGLYEELRDCLEIYYPDV